MIHMDICLINYICTFKFNSLKFEIGAIVMKLINILMKY